VLNLLPGDKASVDADVTEGEAEAVAELATPATPATPAPPLTPQ
jgi:hypothetical protein